MAITNGAPTSKWAVLVMALLGGGGSSALLPVIYPSWYRDDPFHGSEGRQIQKEVGLLQGDMTALREQVQTFLITGPKEVRAALLRVETSAAQCNERMITLNAKMDTLLSYRQAHDARLLFPYPPRGLTYSTAKK